MSYELKVERLIDASPEEVFDAYTDPEAMKVWFTILNEGLIVENEIDLRVGGTWVSSWGFSPEEMFRETQTFEVVDRPHRLVSRSSGSSPDGDSLDTHVDITFTDEGGKTLMTIVCTGFPDESNRDFFADVAWQGLFDRLQAYFTARATR
ncbi:MAG TPA: SRPBCC domain-containing protein [Acidimicrobiia bacterium]|nr:SRPBCC domain-containing protein [Acidimicrobiia bacterium]